MPKLVGVKPHPAMLRLMNNSPEIPGRLVQLRYLQMQLLPPELVLCSLDTTDKGAQGRYGKRWYRWYAKPQDVLESPCSTPKMRLRAQINLSMGAAE